MPIWHQSPKLTPRYFLETPRLFGYPIYISCAIRKRCKMVPTSEYHNCHVVVLLMGTILDFK